MVSLFGAGGVNVDGDDVDDIRLGVDGDDYGWRRRRWGESYHGRRRWWCDNYGRGRRRLDDYGSRFFNDHSRRGVWLGDYGGGLFADGG